MSAEATLGAARIHAAAANRTPAEIQLIERVAAEKKIPFSEALSFIQGAKTDPKMEMQLRNDYAKDIILQRKYPNVNDYLRAMGVTPQGGFGGALQPGANGTFNYVPGGR